MEIQSEKTTVVELIDKNSSLIKKVVILSFGATIHQIIVDNGKKERNVILGYDTAEEYVPPLRPQSHPYHGSTVGRYANRIANGKFTLND
jgi:aldose 1-epimerase